MRVFHCDDDYSTYRRLLLEKSRRAGVDVWSYCLMPNHIHCIAVPYRYDSLSLAFGKTHERFARHINRRNGWTGHLWQERFFSVPMDQEHSVAALRYVLRNPVRAGLVDRPEDWRYSSTRAHLGLVEDPLIRGGSLNDLVDDWQTFLEEDEPEDIRDVLRKCTRSGRPAGDSDFVNHLEQELGRTLRPKPAGRPPRVPSS